MGLAAPGLMLALLTTSLILINFGVDTLSNPRDEYTRLLLQAIPTLDYHVDARSGYVPVDANH